MTLDSEMKQHCLSFDIEEHYQVLAFDCPARRRHWDRLESRVEQNTHKLLELLAAYEVKATMFVVGWVAERHPSLIRQIVQEGHELASHGYAHELITVQSPKQFREDIRRSKCLLEDLSGKSVIGYRAPTFSITGETQWALPILVEEGYAYDSSIFPIIHDSYGLPGAKPYIHSITTESGTLLEVPPSTCEFWGVRVPIAGGGYFRLFPMGVLRRLLKKVESLGQPLVLYLHPWELDPEQPRMNGPYLSRFRHYFNLQKTEERLIRILQEFRFLPIRENIPHLLEVEPEKSRDQENNEHLKPATGTECGVPASI